MNLNVTPVYIKNTYNFKQNISKIYRSVFLYNGNVKLSKTLTLCFVPSNFTKFTENKYVLAANIYLNI